MQEVLWGLLGKKGHSKAESIHSKPHKKMAVWLFKSFLPSEGDSPGKTSISREALPLLIKLV